MHCIAYCFSTLITFHNHEKFKTEVVVVYIPLELQFVYFSFFSVYFAFFVILFVYG